MLHFGSCPTTTGFPGNGIYPRYEAHKRIFDHMTSNERFPHWEKVVTFRFALVQVAGDSREFCCEKLWKPCLQSIVSKKCHCQTTMFFFSKTLLKKVGFYAPRLPRGQRKKTKSSPGWSSCLPKWKSYATKSPTLIRAGKGKELIVLR